MPETSALSPIFV